MWLDTDGARWEMLSTATPLSSTAAQRCRGELRLPRPSEVHARAYSPLQCLKSYSRFNLNRSTSFCP